MRGGSRRARLSVVPSAHPLPPFFFEGGGEALRGGDGDGGEAGGSDSGNGMPTAAGLGGFETGLQFRVLHSVAVTKEPPFSAGKSDAQRCELLTLALRAVRATPWEIEAPR